MGHIDNASKSGRIGRGELYSAASLLACKRVEGECVGMNHKGSPSAHRLPEGRGCCQISMSKTEQVKEEAAKHEDYLGSPGIVREFKGGGGCGWAGCCRGSSDSGA